MFLSTSLVGVSPDQIVLSNHYWVLSMEVHTLLKQVSWASSSFLKGFCQLDLQHSLQEFPFLLVKMYLVIVHTDPLHPGLNGLDPSKPFCTGLE